MLEERGSNARSVVVASMTDNDIHDPRARVDTVPRRHCTVLRTVNDHGVRPVDVVMEPVLDQTSNGWQSFRHQLIYSLYLVSGAIEGSAEGQ